MAATVVASILLPLNGFAEEEKETPWYQVEIIVFVNKEQDGLGSETWPNTPALRHAGMIELRRQGSSPSAKDAVPDFEKIEANLAQFNLPEPYQLLSPSELQLVPVAKKLQRSASYKPLLHIAWRQPTLSPTESVPVFVYDGVDKPHKERGPQGVQPTAAKPGSRFAQVPVYSESYGSITPATEADTWVGPEMEELSGKVRLSVSRYLHLEVDLDFRTPIIKEETVLVPPPPQESGFFTSSEPPAEPTTRVEQRLALQSFRLQESRRMRSKEVHYFDHPMFSVISRVIPYKIPKAPEASLDPSSQAFKPGQTTGNKR